MANLLDKLAGIPDTEGLPALENQLDLIDLNAPKSSHIFIKLAPPRLEYYSGKQTLNFLKNSLNNLGATDVTFYTSDKTVPLGVAQVFQVSVSRQQLPLMFLSTTKVTFLGGQNVIGQGALTNLVIPNNFLAKLKELNVQYTGLNNVAKHLASAIIRSISKKDNEDKLMFFDFQELSDMPFGLILEFKNASGKTLAKVFLEMCKITSMNLSLQASQAVVFENFGFIFHRAKDLD